VPPTRIPPDDVYYPAHMQAITFPTAQAQAAIEVCDRIAALLNDHLLARAPLVSAAQDGWEGAFRTEFDDAWSTQQARIDGLKQDLQRLSGKLSTAISSAATINAQRAEMRREHRESLASTEATP
jgi:hypothetical protein